MRAKLAHAAGSLAVTWLTLSFLVAAAPGSSTMAWIYPAFQGFLQTFDLEHDWGFFAPDPGTGHVVRYEVKTADGSTRQFPLTEALERWDPAYFRFTTLYTKAAREDGDATPGAVRYLCRRHAELSPGWIRMVIAHQRKVAPEAFLEGDDPMADLRVFRRTWHACPKETGT